MAIALTKKISDRLKIDRKTLGRFSSPEWVIDEFSIGKKVRVWLVVNSPTLMTSLILRDHPKNASELTSAIRSIAPWYHSDQICANGDRSMQGVINDMKWMIEAGIQDNADPIDIVRMINGTPYSKNGYVRAIDIYNDYVCKRHEELQRRN